MSRGCQYSNVCCDLHEVSIKLAQASIQITCIPSPNILAKDKKTKIRHVLIRGHSQGNKKDQRKLS
jgi:hypothetical protein